MGSEGIVNQSQTISLAVLNCCDWLGSNPPHVMDLRLTVWFAESKWARRDLNPRSADISGVCLGTPEGHQHGR